MARVPLQHAVLYEAEADALGLDITDYLAKKLAVAHGLPEPEYIRPRKPETNPNQGVLDVVA